MALRCGDRRETHLCGRWDVCGPSGSRWERAAARRHRVRRCWRSVGCRGDTAGRWPPLCCLFARGLCPRGHFRRPNAVARDERERQQIQRLGDESVGCRWRPPPAACSELGREKAAQLTRRGSETVTNSKYIPVSSGGAIVAVGGACSSPRSTSGRRTVRSSQRCDSTPLTKLCQETA